LAVATLAHMSPAERGNLASALTALTWAGPPPDTRTQAYLAVTATSLGADDFAARLIQYRQWAGPARFDVHLVVERLQLLFTADAAAGAHALDAAIAHLWEASKTRVVPDDVPISPALAVL